MLLTSAAAVIAGLGMTVSASGADQIFERLCPAVRAVSFDGVVVSAKREGSNIPQVYTDARNYFFRP